MVDFNRRYAPVYVAGRETFGAAGATFCVAQKNRPGSEYRATFENAIHMVDLLRWYCGGEPVDVTAHAAGDDRWQEDGTAAIDPLRHRQHRRADGGPHGRRLEREARCLRSGRPPKCRAPESVSITVDGVTTVPRTSAEAFGWATATQTFGFAEAVHHFLDRIVETAGRP